MLMLDGKWICQMSEGHRHTQTKRGPLVCILCCLPEACQLKVTDPFVYGLSIHVRVCMSVCSHRPLLVLCIWPSVSVFVSE